MDENNEIKGILPRYAKRIQETGSREKYAQKPSGQNRENANGSTSCQPDRTYYNMPRSVL